jgi:DNA-binding NarL/FixJ family response regulator
MIKVIVADSQELFRRGIAMVLAVDEDLRVVAQCEDLGRMANAVCTYPESIVLFSASLGPDCAGIVALFARSKSHGIVIVKDGQNGDTFPQGFPGVITRNATLPELIESVKCVASGKTFRSALVRESEAVVDQVGARVLRQLSLNEKRIVSLLVEGYKNREISARLDTSEQVIKNNLRRIYDKIGVGDRLELALFTINHPTLMRAVEAAGRKSRAEEMPRALPLGQEQIVAA